jgi:hypothetical protein|tara:strand:- start:4366 stop:4542 length:177 start_codon:yes stop_codon:yes gene_type:complete
MIRGDHMNASTNDSMKKATSSGFAMRVLRSLGAIIVTAIVLYMLFGVPAYLLFGMFFS